MAERGCLALFLAWLFWLPLPFGSVIDAAHLPLVLPPMLLCAAAALLRSRHASKAEQPRAYRIWTGGAVAFVAIVSLQLLPLPDGLLRAVSPESAAIWSSAARVASLSLDAPIAAAAHPISISPNETWRELLRLLGLLAAFQTAALIVTSHTRRMALAATLACAAMFQAIYGVREAALGRYAIWGWVNTKIFDRVTGTFVNPNHFAHYMAIVAPMALFIGAAAWHRVAPEAPLRHRIARLLERHFLSIGIAVVAGIGCVAAILVAQSRGGLLSLAGGFLIGGTLLAFRRGASRRHAAAKVAIASVGFLLLVIALVWFIGRERTVARFTPTTVDEERTLVGRKEGIESALRIWRRFPILGSGFGTFPDIVASAEARERITILHHAHNDYSEIAATTGTLGFAVAFGALVIGCIALARSALTGGGSWRKRAFQLAALTSIGIAAVHALIDFNFYIPANPATLAAIAGAAVPLTIRRSRARSERSAGSDSESTG